MPNLKIYNYVFDAEVIVFDKDGTLIDFNNLWIPRMVSATNAIALACQGGNQIRGQIFQTVAYLPNEDQISGYERG